MKTKTNKTKQNDEAIKKLLEEGREDGEKDFNILFRKAVQPLSKSHSLQK